MKENDKTVFENLSNQLNNEKNKSQELKQNLETEKLKNQEKNWKEFTEFLESIKNSIPLEENFEYRDYSKFTFRKRKVIQQVLTKEYKSSAEEANCQSE